MPASVDLNVGAFQSPAQMFKESLGSTNERRGLNPRYSTESILQDSPPSVVWRIDPFDPTAHPSLAVLNLIALRGPLIPEDFLVHVDWPDASVERKIENRITLEKNCMMSCQLTVGS